VVLSGSQWFSVFQWFQMLEFGIGLWSSGLELRPGSGMGGIAVFGETVFKDGFAATHRVVRILVLKRTRFPDKI